MTKSLEEAIKDMLESDMTTCQTCGKECEHGWDASTIFTANGCITVCSECDPRNQGGVSMNKNLVSINNGTTYLTAEEALRKMSLMKTAQFMDRDTIELANSECVPDCSDDEWLELYLKYNDGDLIIG